MPVLSLALATVLAQVIAEEPVQPRPAAPAMWRSSRHVFLVAIGAADWPRLRSLGRFDAPPGWGPSGGTGFTMQAGYLYNALQLRGAEFLVGASGGLFELRAGAPEGTVVSQDGGSSSDLWLLTSGTWATIDVRIQAAENPFRPFVTAGAGAFVLAVSIDHTGGIVSTTDTEILSRTRAMAWLGLGADWRFGPPERCWGVVAEARVQLVDGGSAAGVASGGGSFRGPIFTFTIGALLGVGH